jgi:hypothetical protein
LQEMAQDRQKSSRLKGWRSTENCSRKGRQDEESEIQFHMVSNLADILKKTITWMTHSCTILAWFFVMCWHRVYIVAWSTQFKVVVSKILERLPTSTGSPQAGCETCGIIGQWRSLIMPFAQSFEGICAGNSHRSDMIW